MRSIDTGSNARGLPGKSYTYVLTLDKYIKMLLSILVNTPFFDYHVSSYITRRFRYKDRVKTVSGFLKYTAISDESRFEPLIENKILRRSDIISLAEDIRNSISTVSEITSSQEPSTDDLYYLFWFNLKFGEFSEVIKSSCPDISKRLDRFKNTIVSHYSSFIIKGLMERRKSQSEPDSLKSDAYYVIMEMLDNYNPKRSKVPFNNFLRFFTKSQKNSVIQRQLWGLKEGSLVSIDNKDDEKDSVIKEIETQLQKDDDNEKLELIEEVIDNLPTPFSNVLKLHYNIINPLTVEEEVNILLNN